MRVDIAADLTPEEAVALASAVGWDATRESAERSLAREPAGAFCARTPDGAAVGSATCVVWDHLAWIGAMVVLPEARGRGVGAALLARAVAYAEARGARSIGLDATPAGRPLYERAGFVPTWGESALWTRAAPGRAAPSAPSGEYAIYPVSPAEIMELVQYDTPRFGAGRGRFLGELMGAEPHRSFVAVHRKTGAFSGHGFVLGDRLGPIVADAPEAAAWLLHALERAGAPGQAIVPAWNADAERLFEGAGYQKGRACTRMVRGAPLPGRPETRYSLGSWSVG